MTYSEAVDSVKSIAFPEREARRLRDVNSNLILDGVIDLYRWVPRLRRRQFSITTFVNTMYKCGTTILSRPENGKVLRVYTYVSDSHCDAVYYQPSTEIEILKAVRQRVMCGSDLPTPDLDDGIDESNQAIGVVMATAGNNKGWRSASGLYAIVDDEILMFPHIEDTENVCVEWRGSRKSFGDDDILTWDRDILHALELWVRSKSGLRSECGDRDYIAFKKEYEDLRADIVIEDRTNEAVDDAEQPFECCSPYVFATSDESETEEDAEEEESTVFASKLLEWAIGEAYEFLERSYDSTNVITTGTVRWPDLSSGTYTRTHKSPWNVVDGYTITHDDSGITVTQPQLTRDANGNITIKPALTLSGYTFTPSGGTASEGGAELAIEGVTALRSLASHENLEVKYLLYLDTDGDGSGGEYIFRSAETAADDGVVYIKPSNIDASDPGRWVRSSNST